MIFGLTCSVCGVTDSSDKFTTNFAYLEDARKRGWKCDVEPTPGPVKCPTHATN